MTLTFTPFRAGHLNFLTPQGAQRADHRALLASGAASVLEGPTALSAWCMGACLGMAGCIPVHQHRAVAWLLLSEGASAHMLAITRKIKRVLQVAPWRRIEISVTAGFEDGRRFATLLGATLETPEPMRFYGPDGDAQYMYAIVKD